jgi:hypothetical protein
MKKGSKKRHQEQDEQLEFRFDGKRRGGKRKGAGRKKSDNSGVSHCKRDAVKKGLPIHVTISPYGGGKPSPDPAATRGLPLLAA